jgi:hypothetical protein
MKSYPNPVTMKQIFHDSKMNAAIFFQDETSLMGRSQNVRTIPGAFILLNISYILFSILKNIR